MTLNPSTRTAGLPNGVTDNGVVTGTAVRADERIYYSGYALPYTPAKHFRQGRIDPAFWTRLQIGAGLATAARAAGFRVPGCRRGLRLWRSGRVPR
jgi:hypothetical protein